jgi:hypothetical protein
MKERAPEDSRGLPNSPANIGRLFDIHAGIGFEGNLARLVEATDNNSPMEFKFVVNESAAATILDAPQRATVRSWMPK